MSTIRRLCSGLLMLVRSFISMMPCMCIYEIKELDYNKWKQRSNTELLLQAYFSSPCVCENVHSKKFNSFDSK